MLKKLRNLYLKMNQIIVGHFNLLAVSVAILIFMSGCRHGKLELTKSHRAKFIALLLFLRLRW